MEEKIKHIFKELSEIIANENQVRQQDGRTLLQAGEICILGQMSLLLNEKVSAVLHLAQTADMDAKLTLDFFVKTHLKKLLKDNGLVYDEDSDLVWVPKDAKFIPLYEFKYIKVFIVDPESALLSKAIRAPKKNKLLIAEAIASNQFPKLADRIIEAGGNLEDFI